MAKNEIPFYTKTSRFITAAGAAATNINLLSTASEGSKLVCLSPNFLIQRSTTGNESSVEIRVILFDGTTNHELNRIEYTTSAANPRIYGATKNLLNDLNLPKDRNGNSFLNLPVNTLIKYLYPTPTAGAGGGAIAVFNSMFCHMEDY